MPILKKNNAPRGKQRGKAKRTSSKLTAAEKKTLGRILAKARAAKAAKRNR